MTSEEVVDRLVTWYVERRVGGGTWHRFLHPDVNVSDETAVRAWLTELTQVDRSRAERWPNWTPTCYRLIRVESVAVVVETVVSERGRADQGEQR